MQGKIVKNISNDFTVLCSDNKLRTCKARGKFRNMKLTPLVGDNVTIDENNNYILELLPRKNELIRPSICNIDTVFIIASTKKPDFDTNLLDKLLCIAEYNLIKPVIVLTKLDLLSEEEKSKLEPVFNYYKKIGYDVVENTNLDKIKKLIKDKVSVFTGQSGAGKSTLLNRLDETFNIKTNEISLALGRGKHTTRHTEFFFIEGGMVADTPGFSSLDFKELKMSKEDIRDNFTEFFNLSEDCKYKDCMHYHDDGCKVKEELEKGNVLPSRYENYIKFITNKE